MDRLGYVNESDIKLQNIDFFKKMLGYLRGKTDFDLKQEEKDEEKFKHRKAKEQLRELFGEKLSDSEVPADDYPDEVKFPTKYKFHQKEKIALSVSNHFGLFIAPDNSGKIFLEDGKKFLNFLSSLSLDDIQKDWNIKEGLGYLFDHFANAILSPESLMEEYFDQFHEFARSFKDIEKEYKRLSIHSIKRFTHKRFIERINAYNGRYLTSLLEINKLLYYSGYPELSATMIIVKLNEEEEKGTLFSYLDEIYKRAERTIINKSSYNMVKSVLAVFIKGFEEKRQIIKQSHFNTLTDVYSDEDEINKSEIYLSKNPFLGEKMKDIETKFNMLLSNLN